MIVSVAPVPAAVPLPPYGDLWLDLAGALVVTDSIPVSSGRRTFAFVIPNVPQLVGVELNVQGFVAAASGGVHLTGLKVATIQ